MKIRISYTVEYEVHPENYPPGSTPDEMLEIDIDSYSQDPFDLVSMDGEVSGEIVK